MKTATITWVNSVSLDVVKHVVYRDSVKLGEVGISFESIWVDTKAEEGKTYKYEIQAATSTSESTKEVELVNVQTVFIAYLPDTPTNIQAKYVIETPTGINLENI